MAAQTAGAPPAAPKTAAPAAAAAPAPATAPAATAGAPAAAPALSAEQASYNFGMTFGEQLRHVGLNDDINVDAMTRGLKDSLGGKKLSPGDQQQLSQYVRNVREAAGTRNKNAAKEFLASNGQQKGIKTTASGLQYKILTPGDVKASSPRPEDQVTVQYRGKLLDGTEFDSSFSRGQPATMQANRVIKGWQEALALMKPGSKWELYIPPELGYDLNSPPGIPPGSLLIFDVDLLTVQAAPKAN
jgi:FKBP-type peptidyl-prolyl cis-trans isomerase